MWPPNGAASGAIPLGTRQHFTHFLHRRHSGANLGYQRFEDRALKVGAHGIIPICLGFFPAHHEVFERLNKLGFADREAHGSDAPESDSDELFGSAASEVADWG